MKDRDDVEEVWDEATAGLAGELLDILDGAAPSFNLRRLARVFYREGYQDRGMVAALRRVAREAEEQVEAPVPQAAQEEVERPREDSPLQERVARPTPLGEAPLDKGPEVEGVGGAGELKEHRYGEHLRHFFVDNRGIQELHPAHGTPTRAFPGDPDFNVVTAREILRLANRVRELEGALSALRPALAYGQSAIRWRPIWEEALHRVDQALSSGGGQNEPGNLTDVAAVGREDGE